MTHQTPLSFGGISGNYDAAALDRLRRFGGEKLVREMAELFTMHAEQRLTDARTALASSDANAIRHALHTLKSSAAQLGAEGVRRLCHDGETRAAAGDLTGIAGLLESLEGELRSARSWLRAAITV